MRDCIGIINLDEKEDNLKELISKDSISSMEFAGRYKVIDFALSNLTNSGVDRIGIFTKRKSSSILSYLNNNRSWNISNKKNGINVFNYGEYDICKDDVHNFIENIEFIEYSNKEYVIIIPSYMICNIDYKRILDFHKKSKRDITVIYKQEREGGDRFLECEEISIGFNNKVIDINKVDKNEEYININMEMYIMKTSLFIDIVRKSVTTGLYKKVKEYIKYNLETINVGAYEFSGYLSCINSIKSFFESNKEILNIDISNELFYKNKSIYTDSREDVPVYYSKTSKVINSIVANGSYIEGKIENSIIGKNVKISEGAIIKNSIIMNGAYIDKGSIINNTIVKEKSIIQKYQIFNGNENYPEIV